MSYKNTLLFFLFIAGFISCDKSSSEKKPAKQPAQYKFDAPKGWATEKIPFPIEFAPQIPYKGLKTYALHRVNSLPVTNIGLILFYGGLKVILNWKLQC